MGVVSQGKMCIMFRCVLTCMDFALENVDC